MDTFDLSFYKGKKVFVTGHTGFKGSWLCKILANAGAVVTGYSLTPPTSPSLFEIAGIEQDVNSVIGDIRDYKALKTAFDEAQPEIVLHLAAQPIVRDSYKDPAYTYETNVMGTVNILECVRNNSCVKSFLNVTTDKVYLNKEWAWGYRENEELDGYDPYSNSKSCSELVTHSYKNSFFNDNHVAISTARAGNVIGVGDYIEQIFPLMGVRFIAVNNSFDSMKLNNGTPGIEVAVSNLVNNMYSRDIAKKVRAALETNWKNGKATCTNVPFGYVWNKKGGQRWEIDPEAAPCVKKVFELALSGRNTTQIAYGMNELNLPTPGLYAKRKNLLMGSNPIIAPDSEMLWNAAIVWRILRRYEYTGALVMGRRKKIDVNTTSVRTLPEDRWIIAENAHAAIVTKDEYYQAQKAIRNVTPIQYKVGDDFALKGKICCGNCNRQLRHERQYGEKLSLTVRM